MSPTDTTSRAADPSDEADVIAVLAAQALDDKLGEDIVALDVGPILGICDWFVVANGRNDRQVKALCDEVELRVAEGVGRRPRSVEGLDTRGWVVLDYGDVVVHVFGPDERHFYRIERLFDDAMRLDWQTSEASAAPESS